MFNVDTDIFNDIELAVISTLENDDGSGNMLNPKKCGELFKTIEQETRNIQHIGNFILESYDKTKLPLAWVGADSQNAIVNTSSTMEEDYKVGVCISILSNAQKFDDVVEKQNILEANVMRVLRLQQDSVNNFSASGGVASNVKVTQKIGRAMSNMSDYLAISLVEFVFFNVYRFK